MSCTPSTSMCVRSGRSHAGLAVGLTARLGVFGVVAALVALVALVALPARAGEQTTVGNVDVVQGTGAVTVNEQTRTTLTSEGRVIYEWDGIHQPADHTLQFDQSGADAAALNRGTGQNPFEFFGTVKSNGKVIFANEAGIHFHDGSSVLVYDLLAAAGRLSDGAFLSDQMLFTDLNGSVVNDGTITGLRVGLLGQRVANHGDIYVEDGQLLMLAGDRVLIREHDSPIVINVPMSTPATATTPDDPAIENTGHIDAGAYGRVRLAAADGLAYAIRNRVVERIAQTGSAEPPPSGVIRAGSIELVGGESSAVEVGGLLDATRDDKNVTGGQIDVFGERIAIADGAVLDASGAEGGGRIRVGGDRQGQGDAPRSALVVVNETAALHADATWAGDGGEVIVWSDGQAHVHGEVTARGGEIGGDGGFVETSGRAYLELTRAANVSARSGRSVDLGGEWLIDPYDIFIGDYGPDCLGAQYCLNEGIDLDDLFFVNNPVLFAPGQPSLLDADVLAQALSEGSSITVTTSSGTSEPGTAGGNITVDGAILPGIDAAENTAVALVLRAANHIFVNADIRPADGAENLNLAVQLIANDVGGQREAPDEPNTTPNRFVGDVQVSNDAQIGTNRSNVLMQGVNVILEAGTSIVTDGGSVILAAVGGVDPAGDALGGGDAVIDGDIDTSNSRTDEQGEPLAGGTLTIQSRFGDVAQAGAPPESVSTLGGNIGIGGTIDLGRHAGGTALTIESLGGNVDLTNSILTGGGNAEILAVRVTDNVAPEADPAEFGGTVTLADSASIDTDGGSVTIEALGRFPDNQVRSRDFETKVSIRGVIDTTPADNDRDSDGLIDTVGGLVVIRADGQSAENPSGVIEIIDESATPGMNPLIVTGGGDVEINFDVDTDREGTPDGPSLASIHVAGSIDAGLEEGKGRDVGFEDAIFGVVTIDASGALTVENTAPNGSTPVTLRGERVVLRSANRSSQPGTRRGDLTFVSNGAGEGVEIWANDIALFAGVDSLFGPSERDSRVNLGATRLRDVEGGNDINSITFAQNATITSADLPQPNVNFDDPATGEALDDLLYFVQSLAGSVLLDDPSLFIGTPGGVGTTLGITAHDTIAIEGLPASWADANLLALDLALDGGFTVDPTLAANVSAATDDLTITSGRLRSVGRSDLTIEAGVRLDALENLLLHAATDGSTGDLIFAGEADGLPEYVDLRSRHVTLWAGVGQAGSTTELAQDNRVVLDDGTETTVRFDVVGGTEPGDRSFSLRQEATITDDDVPDIGQFMGASPGQIGLIDYALRSDSGDISLGQEGADKLAYTDLRLLAWGDLDIAPTTDGAPIFQVRSLDIGRSQSFQVTQSLLDAFTFAAPTGQTTDAALTLRAAVIEEGALTFDTSEDADEDGEPDGVTVTADRLSLVSGDGTGGNGVGSASSATSAIFVDGLVRFTRFTQPDPENPAPLDAFVFDQDADVQVFQNESGTSSPLPDIDVNFVGGAPATYAVRSNDGGIQLILAREGVVDGNGNPVTFPNRLPLATDFTILTANNVTVSRLDGVDLVLDTIFTPDPTTDSQRLEVRAIDALFGAADSSLNELQDDGVTPNPLPDDPNDLARIITKNLATETDPTRGLFVYGFAGEELDSRADAPVPEPLDLSYQTAGAADPNHSIPLALGFEQDATVTSDQLLDPARIGNGCGFGDGASCDADQIDAHTRYFLASRHGDLRVSPEKVQGANLVLELLQALQDDPVKGNDRRIRFDDGPGGAADRTFVLESLDASTPYRWQIDANTTLVAPDFIVLSAGTSGRGDLGFATGVTLQSEDILLEAIGPSSRGASDASLPIVDARKNAPIFDFRHPDSDRDSNDDRFTISQDGYINDNDVDRIGEGDALRRTIPERSQIVGAGTANDDPTGTLFAYTLDSKRRGIFIGELAQVAAQRLLLFANSDEVYDGDPNTVDRPGRITIDHTNAPDPNIDFATAGVERVALVGDAIELIAGPGGVVRASGTMSSEFFADVGGVESPALAFLIQQDQSFTDAQNALNLPDFFQFASGITGVEYTLRLAEPAGGPNPVIEIGAETAAKLRGTALTLEAIDDVKIDVPIKLLEGLVLTSLDVRQADWVDAATPLVIQIGDVLIVDSPTDSLDESATSTQIETIRDQTYAGTVEIVGNVNFLGRDITFEGDVLNASTAAGEQSSLDFLTRGTVAFGGQVGCIDAGGATCDVGANDWASALAASAEYWFDRIRVFFDADDDGHDALAFDGFGAQSVYARDIEIAAIAPSENITLPLEEVIEVTATPTRASIYKTDPQFDVDGVGDADAGITFFTETRFRMAPGQKASAQGDFEVQSRDLIQLGDVSALDILVDVSDSGQIEVQRRAGAPYLTPSGRTITDAGITFVANTIDFAGDTIYTGSGRNPAFAIEDPRNPPATIANFTLTAIDVQGGALEKGDFEWTFEDAPRALPALHASGPPRNDISRIFGGLERAPLPAPWMPNQLLVSDPRKLRQLAVEERDRTEAEWQRHLAEAGIIDDIGRGAARSDGLITVARARLLAQDAEEAIALHEQIFGVDGVRAPYVRAVLGDALAQYRRSSGTRQVVGFEFRRYVKNRPSSLFEAYQVFEDLDALFDRHRALGLTPGEYRPIQAEWLREITPEGITIAELAEAIHPSRYVRGTDILDIFGD